MEKRHLNRPLRITTGLLSFCMVAFSTPDAVAADGFLAHFAGTWIGQGALRPSEDAAREAVYCRVTAELSPDGSRLQQSGRCAVGDQSRRVNGVLIYDEARRLVTGSWSGAREGPVEVVGQRRNDRLVMQLKYKRKDTDATSSMTLQTISDGRYRMVVAGPEGRGEIEFRRQ